MIGSYMVFTHPAPCAAHSPANPLTSLSFQQLPTIKLNYPTRIVHAESSEGSLCLSAVDITKPSVPLSFQQLPTIKFCNHFALITIRIAGGGRTPSPSLAAFTPSSHRLFSYTYELPNLQPPCFDNVATVGGYPPLRGADQGAKAGITIGNGAKAGASYNPSQGQG